MSPGPHKRTSIDLDPDVLQKFTKACQDCGEEPKEVLQRWISSAVRQHQGRGTSRRTFALIPGKRRRRKESPDASLRTRLQILIKSKDYAALMKACHKHNAAHNDQIDLSGLIRSWVSHLLHLYKQGGDIAEHAEAEAFKTNVRSLVYDARLQIRMMHADLLNRFRRMCRKERLSQSRVLRGWIAHILSLDAQGKGIMPPAKKVPPRR